MTLNLQDPYLAYYKNQLGGGVSAVYRGSPYQRGHGIGSFLGGLFRTITPLLKSGAKAVGKEALRTGINVLSDVVGTNVPVKHVISNRMQEFTGSLKRKADNKLNNVIMTGSGKKGVRRSYKKKTYIVTPQSLQRLLTVRHRQQPRRKIQSGRVKKNKKKTNSKKTKKKKRVQSKDIFN